MKNSVVVLAAACVVGVLWLILFSPSEDSSDSRDARSGADVSRSDGAPDGEGEALPGAAYGGDGSIAGHDDLDPARSGAEGEEAMSQLGSAERFEAIKRRAEAAEDSGRGTRLRDSHAANDEAEEGEEDTGPSHRAIREQAAELALQLRLIPPAQLELRVEHAVPDGSLPPEEIEPAREAVREELLRDELILDYLTDQALPEDTSAAERLRRRSLGDTLLSGQSEEYKNAKALEALEAYGATP